MIFFVTRYFLLPDRAVSGKDQPILEPSQSRKGSDYRKKPAEEMITAGVL